LKIGNNKIKSLEKVLSFVKKMKQLTKLDLAGNDVTNEEDYRDKVMKALRQNASDPEERIILDGHDEDNISVSDDSEDEDEPDEEGEMEMMDNEMLANLDPEIKKKFKNGELSLEELEKMGLINFADYGEEGEAELYGSEDEDEEGGEKRAKTDE
jgi:Leucine-rich repeat (LRR) protein